MHNNEGKNPLEIIEGLDLTGYSEGKKNNINDMRQQMEKMGSMAWSPKELSALIQHLFTQLTRRSTSSAFDDELAFNLTIEALIYGPR